MKLGEIMSTRVVTVEFDDSLATVKEIFDSLRFHHLLVVGSDRKLCGVISDRDLLRAISPYVGTP
jgi:acetoin utilization protein AcuB